MAEIIAQSVAKRVPLKAYLADGVTDATGKTIAVVISKNGGAFGNPSAGATNATEIGSGWYYVDLSTTDTNTTGPLLVRGTATGVDNTETAYTVAASGSDPWATALPGAYAAGSAGFILGINLDAAVTSRASAAALATVQADTDNIQTRLPAALVGGRMDSDVAVIQTDAISAAAVSAAAVTKIQAGLATAASIVTLQADTDNIQTRLPAALVGGRMDSDVAVIQTDAISAAAVSAAAVTKIQAGLGTSANQTTINNNVLAVSAAIVTVQADTDNIQTRLPAALVGGRMDSSVGANAANVITAASMAADASAEIADRILGRSVQGGADGGRTVTDSLRPSRNKSEIVAGILTVYAEDDVTPAWTAAVTTAAGNPITAIDPA